MIGKTQQMCSSKQTTWLSILHNAWSVFSFFKLEETIHFLLSPVMSQKSVPGMYQNNLMCTELASRQSESNKLSLGSNETLNKKS